MVKHKQPMRWEVSRMDRNSAAWWDFCDNEKVIDLNQQLADGVIHPVEYANAIIELAMDAGL